MNNKMCNRRFFNNRAKFIKRLNVLQDVISLLLAYQHSLTLKNSNAMDIIPSYQNVTTIVKLKGKDIKVHALCTGTVAVKTNFRKKNGMGELAKLNILFDGHYTEYMPI